MAKLNSFLDKNKYFFVLILIVIGLLLITLRYYSKEYTINNSYNGIKYQSNGIDKSINVKIEISGEYLKGFLGRTDMFKGKIIINGENCFAISGDGSRSDKYEFNKEKMSYIETDSFEGFIFVEDYMRNITITIDKIKDIDNEIYSFNNGWLISAPCKSRDEAVNISNKLIQKLHNDVLIK